MTLTPQQQRVAELVAEGMSDQQIAAAIGRCNGRVRQLIEQITDAWRLDRSRNLRVQIALRAASSESSTGSARTI